MSRFFDKNRLSSAKESDIVKWFFSDFPFSKEELSQTEIIEDLFQNQSVLPVWKDMAALSLLFIKDESLKNTKELFTNYFPFSNISGTFSELDKENLSLAFFPINTGSSGQGSWALLALFEHSGKLFFDLKECLWKKEWSNGNSWKLAYNLAQKALHEPDFKDSLAKEWIITGDVDELGKVKRVELGNKLMLPTKRNWLVPLENINQISPETAARKVIRSADMLETAWNHITGKGVKATGEQDWPEEVDELHVLVGGNIKAQVGSILLTKCKKVVLWHSESNDFSKIPAKQIEEVVNVIYRGSLFIEAKYLSSKDMAEAEKTLVNYFKEKNSSLKILFNVTSGNRLMSYAAQSIARLHPNVDLIYRDSDETVPNRFNILNYREFPPYLGAVVGNIDICKIDDSFLYSSKKDYTNEIDFLEKLINPEKKC